MPTVMQALHDRVPLSLLADLACSSGPDSAEILRREGGEFDWRPETMLQRVGEAVRTGER